MAANVNIPQNLTKVIEVRDTSEQLRRFLIDLLIRIDFLEEQVKELKVKTKDLP